MKVQSYVDEDAMKCKHTSHFSTLSLQANGSQIKSESLSLEEKKWNLPIEVIYCEYQCFGRDLSIWNLKRQVKVKHNHHF